MILQIHDEIVVELPKSEASEVKKILIHEMEHVIKWPVPLKVTLREGANWGEVTK